MGKIFRSTIDYCLKQYIICLHQYVLCFCDAMIKAFLYSSLQCGWLVEGSLGLRITKLRDSWEVTCSLLLLYIYVNDERTYASVLYFFP